MTTCIECSLHTPFPPFIDRQIVASCSLQEKVFVTGAVASSLYITVTGKFSHVEAAKGSGRDYIITKGVVNQNRSQEMEDVA